MIRKPKKSPLFQSLRKGVAFAVAIHLCTGAQLAGAAEQPLLNNTLPLPDFNLVQFEKQAREAKARQAAAKNAATAPPAQPAVTGTQPAALTQQTTLPVLRQSQPESTATSTATAPLKRDINAGTLLKPAIPVTPAASAGEATTPATQVTAATQKPAKTADSESNSSWLEDALGDSQTPTLRAPIEVSEETKQATAAEAAAAIEAVKQEAATSATAEPAAAASQQTTAETTEQHTTATANAEQSKSEVVLESEASTATFASSTPSGDVEILKSEDAQKLKSGMALLPYPTIAPGATKQVGVFQAPIVIDNDEIEEQEATIAYEEMPLDDETKTKVKAGARFPIVITSEINSRTAKKGDPVHGRLKYDLKVGDRLVAVKGSVVRGHLNYALPARTPMKAMLSPNRWYRHSGCLGITFDEIINEKNEHIPLVAEPARQALYVKNKGEGRVLGINHKGQITGPFSEWARYKAIRVGMNFAMAPLGAMSFGAMPVALGVMGAVNPSFAFMKPVGLNVRHRRIKGFAWGFLSGVPGSWLIEDTTVKGQEAIIKPGDEFLAEIRQEFTGEPASDAEMLGGAKTKVEGEIVGRKGGKDVKEIKKNKKAK